MLLLRPCLTITQTIRLALVGGVSDTIFPEAEWLLQSDTDFYDALKFIAARKKMNRYRSVIDFLFAELHPQWRSACFRYYLHGGDELLIKHQLTDEQRIEYCGNMLRALYLARAQWKEDLWKSWGWLVEETKAA